MKDINRIPRVAVVYQIETRFLPDTRERSCKPTIYSIIVRITWHNLILCYAITHDDMLLVPGWSIGRVLCHGFPELRQVEVPQMSVTTIETLPHDSYNKQEVSLFTAQTNFVRLQ